MKPSARSISSVALFACILYGAGSLLLGERFPFSMYDMYARAGGGQEGAIFTVLADGIPADIESFERFHAIDPAALYPAGIPCSTEYCIAHARRWIQGRLGRPDDGRGPIHLQIGYRIITVSGGRVIERFRVVAEGTAWPS